MLALEQLRQDLVLHITSGGQIMALAGFWYFDNPWPRIWLAALMCAISLYAWTSAFRRLRTIDDTPTSRISTAAQGYVEFSGHAERHPDYNTLSHVRALPCCWCRYKVERKEGDDWVLEAQGETSETFALVDATGRCVVDPDGAEIVTAHKESWSDQNRRYTEELLLPQDKLYAIGNFVTLSGANTDYDLHQETNIILAEWKLDRPALLARFDANGDGEIDMNEWEEVRKAAVKEAESRRRASFSQEARQVYLLRRPQDGRPFLLSNLPEGKLTAKYRWWGWFHLALLLTAVVLGVRACMHS